MITTVTQELQTKEFTEIHLQLKKSLTVLSQCIAEWKEAEIGANAHLKQVINLTDQYQCCARVQTQNLPLHKQFPDVRQRLLYKINTDINKEVAELKEYIERLGEKSDRMGKQYNHCIRHYDNYSTVEDIQTIVVPYTHLPPISEMLEWIERSERLLRDSYLCKKHLLTTFSPLQADIVDNLEKLWYRGDQQMLQQLSLYISSYAES